MRLIVLFLMLLAVGFGAQKIPSIWYTCEDNAADAVILDSAGSSNAAFGATTTATLSSTGKDGVANTAFQLTATLNDRITLDSAFTFTGDADGSTFNMWIYPPITTAAFLMYEDSDNNIGFTASDEMTVKLATVGNAFSLSADVSADEWQMWTVIYEANDDINIYKNGVDVNAGADNVDDSVNQIEFTEIARSGKSTWTVKFDDITVWDKALTATEVSSLYNAGLDQRSVVVAFIVDIHAREHTEDDYSQVVLQDSTSWYRGHHDWERVVREFVAQCVAYDVDLAMLGGDQIDSGASDDDALLEDLYDKLEEMLYTDNGIPWVHAWGNHEDSGMTAVQFATSWDNATSRSEGENQWPADANCVAWTNESILPWFTVGAGSSIDGAAEETSHWDEITDFDGTGNTSQSQGDWLTASLAQTHAPFIFISHEHLNDGDGLVAYTEDTRTAINNILDAHNKKVFTFSGHYHRLTGSNTDINAYSSATDGDITYIEQTAACLRDGTSDYTNNNFTIWRIYTDGSYELLYRFRKPSTGSGSSGARFKGRF